MAWPKDGIVVKFLVHKFTKSIFVKKYENPFKSLCFLFGQEGNVGVKDALIRDMGALMEVQVSVNAKYRCA